jgi:hypothetical protein
MKKLLYISLSILLFSCSKDRDALPPIPAKIKPYVESFLREAKQRGVLVSVYNINFVATDASLGESGYYDAASHTLSIDTTSNKFLFNAEALVFHELGHGVLKRDHKTGSLSNPEHDILSLMDCCGDVNYFGEYSYKRVYYVDELFNPSTLSPYWAN